MTFKHYYVDEPEKQEELEMQGFGLFDTLKSLKKDTKQQADFTIRERVILQDFNLEIKPGTTNAIVGPSGFGKTTLFNLLFRIYDPESGKIFIDGQNVANLDFKSFRKYISLIP